MGPLRMHIKVADIEDVEVPEKSDKKKGKRKEKSTTETPRSQRKEQKPEDEIVDPGLAGPELRVAGMRVDEAREQGDKFLDNSVMAGHAHVRIITGHGHGALRYAMTEMFAEHPHVASFRPPDYEHGGDGVTVVTLRGE